MSRLAVADLSIVLVEPSAMQLKLIMKHLQEEGIAKIEGVQSGQETLALFSKYQPDLLISSMYLPDMNAGELFHKLRSDMDSQETAFMLISSTTDWDALEQIRQSGVVAILPKPFDHEDLKRALKATIEYVDAEQIELEHYDIQAINVLVVDDSSTARNHIKRVLNNLGVQSIVTAKDGQEALELYTSDPDAIDLIVTDFNMPKMDGKDLVANIRQKIGNTFIPIIMVTSEDNEMRLNNVRQAGVSAICDKPFEIQYVKELLFRLMDDA